MHLYDQKGVTSVVPPTRRGIECCASRYPELRLLVRFLLYILKSSLVGLDSSAWELIDVGKGY